MALSNRPPATIRLGTPDDDPAIAALIGKAAPGNPKADLSVLRWQYRSEEFGPTVTAVAESDGEIVGHYSAITVPVSVDRREGRAGRGVDIVTAPDKRSRGVFSQVTEFLLEQLSETGVGMVISNPNDSSWPVLAKRGWTHIGDPRILAYPVDGAALVEKAPVPLPAGAGRLAVRAIDLARRGKTRLEGRSDRRPVAVEPLTASSFATQTDEIEHLLEATASPTGVTRSVRWLRWRYLDHPHRPYHFLTARHRDRLTGLAVLSIRDDAEGKFVQILDLVATDKPSQRALASAAAAYASSHNAAALLGAALAGSDHDQALRAAGLLPVPRRLQPRPLRLTVAPIGPKYPDLASRRWNFSFGDQDHL